MFLHLGMDELRDGALVAAQHLARFILGQKFLRLL
jgi:hypothetical protein